jgi:hypothetical protein
MLIKCNFGPGPKRKKSLCNTPSDKNIKKIVINQTTRISAVTRLSLKKNRGIIVTITHHAVIYHLYTNSHTHTLTSAGQNEPLGQFSHTASDELTTLPNIPSGHLQSNSDVELTALIVIDGHCVRTPFSHHESTGHAAHTASWSTRHDAAVHCGHVQQGRHSIAP